ncbi:cryptochrome/photolyase family protein [Ideonella margarita]|uniref:Deoxyribodipyrimidine photo-lyase n=1 Tax=Ideonella margarita TaxID=2984191 RepID=A0ABU9BZF3_9BURK
MQASIDAALVWFRRDLRADDHAALYAACRAARQVWCVFVFDSAILDALPRKDRRVEFIRDSLVDLDAQLTALGQSHGRENVHLIVRHGWATREIPALARQLGVQAVFANHDDEPDAVSRDAQVRGALSEAGVSLYTTKDHVVFERDEVMTGGGTSYSVFTPYKNAWLRKVNEFYLRAWPVARHASALAGWPARVGQPGVPALSDIGFEPSDLHTLKLPTGSTGARELLDDFLHRIDLYEDARNFPAVKGPSYLSTHLRFGTVSIRTLAREALHRSQGGSRGAEVWLSELIWRDFYHQILHHHPRVVGHSFKPEYDAVKWEHGKHGDALFAAWCEGRTGYPLVDAAMLQLLKTGYMHNRLRMISASFLTKDLGIDWRRGEAWFALHLNDFDLAANNGGWQWAASTGCDAQPYFRIFNPVTQSERFDPDGKFIRRYLPQLAGLGRKAIHAPWLAKPLELVEASVKLGIDYPEPVVDHDAARQLTLARFAAAREGKAGA